MKNVHTSKLMAFKTASKLHFAIQLDMYLTVTVLLKTHVSMA